MKATDIAETFDVSLDDAKLALKIINWKVKLADFADKLPKTYDEFRYLDTDNFGIDCSCRLAALDELLGTFGVEPIRTTEHIDRYWFDCRACYLNTGDTYNTTILFDTKKDRFYLTSWGDFVESLDGKKDDNGDPIEVY
jgi:hypothetical protein